jgi:hypothetical protein
MRSTLAAKASAGGIIKITFRTYHGPRLPEFIITNIINYLENSQS